MSVIIGLAIERDHLRAVGVRGGRVLWGVDAALTEDTTLGNALGAFLEKLPVRPFFRPRLTVALGAAFAQTKRLAGLPPIADERLLAQTVSEHAARFFLKNGVPLVTTSVRLDPGGGAWAAALQKTVVDTVVSVCRTSRLRLTGIVPVADVVRDDAPALQSLGDQRMEFAAAYGAAVTSSAVIWREGTGIEERAPHWRMLAISGVAGLALLLAVVAPGLSAAVAEHRAIVHLASTTTPRRDAQGVAREVGLVTRALDEVAAFDAARRSVTMLLAALAKALPEESALLAFHMDSTGGSLVAMTPRPGALLTSLDRVPGLAAAEITGPVTREAVSGRELERVTVRFRWTGHP